MKKLSKNIVPRLKLIQWLGDERLRLFFDVGGSIDVREITIDGSTRKARIVDEGMGLDPGDGLDRSAYGLYTTREGNPRRPVRRALR